MPIQKKRLTREMLENLFHADLTYYYLESDCPEIMDEDRVLQYATNIIEANERDENLPDKFKSMVRVKKIEDAQELINWFGEEIFELDFSTIPTSIQLLTKLNKVK